MEPVANIGKKLRSKRPRRRRLHISPVLCSSILCNKSGLSSLFADSSSNTHLDTEVSCDSNRVSKNFIAKKREFTKTEEPGSSILRIERTGDWQFRRITRSYYRQMENEKRINELEVSESSCVESNSGVDFGVRNQKLKKARRNLTGIERSVNDAVSVMQSEISCVEQVSDSRNLETSLENKENDVVSNISGVEFCSEAVFSIAVKGNGNRAPQEGELSETSKPDNAAEANLSISNSESVLEQRQKLMSFGFDSDLACTEQFSYDDISEYSELQDIFQENSDLDFSEYTPSIFYDSGSEFSQKSYSDSPPSMTYSLLLEFREQFSRSTTPLDVAIPSNLEENYPNQPTLVRFDDEDDEQSYQMFRERERREKFLRDYTEEYRCTTEYGDLILQQRSDMIHWIVEQCSKKELQQETMFLGVSLLDRFLSRGFFKNKRSLQIVGIACLVLATRIEENQPYNSVRQKSFCIGSDTYSRNEVVAMEWLVQEVLNFQCFLPTIYNFLWFYLKAAKADAEMEKKVKYLAVLALSDHEQLCYWPSTVAAGLVILASMENNQNTSCKRVIEIHVRTKDSDLPECIKSLQWLLQFVS
ncbi:cyclin-SDS [Carica papaya]|uniref:cyclin-SDS n=1 Tax=Carica papaya TaxID=3649 RepID=UPI000B8C81B0|nr:cyclin-SDS [Carica papaya]